MSLFISKVSDFQRGGERQRGGHLQIQQCCSGIGTRLAAFLFSVCSFLIICMLFKKHTAAGHTQRGTQARIKTSVFSSYNSISCHRVFNRRSCGSVVRVHNSEVKVCRWKSRPPNPPPPKAPAMFFMHILSQRCCLQTLTKHIHLNCHTLHFCFPNCAIILHEWCSSLTQMPRNILHTEKLFKWAQINDGLSSFSFFSSYGCTFRSLDSKSTI